MTSWGSWAQPAFYNYSGEVHTYLIFQAEMILDLFGDYTCSEVGHRHRLTGLPVEADLVVARTMHALCGRSIVPVPSGSMV
jgi:hypothetical protein